MRFSLFTLVPFAEACEFLAFAYFAQKLFSMAMGLPIFFYLFAKPSTLATLFSFRGRSSGARGDMTWRYRIWAHHHLGEKQTPYCQKHVHIWKKATFSTIYDYRTDTMKIKIGVPTATPTSYTWVSLLTPQGIMHLDLFVLSTLSNSTIATGALSLCIKWKIAFPFLFLA